MRKLSQPLPAAVLTASLTVLFSLFGASTAAAFDGPYGDLPERYAPTEVRALLLSCASRHDNDTKQALDDTREETLQCIASLQQRERSNSAPSLAHNLHYTLSLLYRRLTQTQKDNGAALYQWRGQAQHALTTMQQNIQPNTGQYSPDDRLVATWVTGQMFEAILITSYGDEKENALLAAKKTYENIFPSQTTPAEFNAVQEYWAAILATHSATLEQSRYWLAQQCHAAERGKAWERVFDCRSRQLPVGDDFNGDQDDSLNERSNEDSMHNYYMSLADFAIQHDLNTKAVIVLTNPASLVTLGNDNPTSPDIARFKSRLEKGCALAKSAAEKGMCEYGRLDLYRRTGNHEAAADTIDELLPLLSDHNAVAVLATQVDLFELIGSIGFLLYQQEDYQQSSAIFSQLVAQQIEINGQPNEETLYRYAVTSFHAGTDPLSLPDVQAMLARKKPSARFLILAAASHYRNNDIDQCLTALQRADGEMFSGTLHFAHSRIMLIHALQGDYAFFQAHWNDVDVHSFQHALAQSYQAILQQQENPNIDYTLTLQGELFPLRLNDSSFVSFTAEAEIEAAHVSAEPTGTKIATQLVLDPGVDPDRVFTPRFDLSSDGKWLVVCESDNYCYLRDADTGRLVRRWATGDVADIHILNNSVLLTRSQRNNRLDIWELDTGKRQHSVEIASAVGVTVTPIHGKPLVLIQGEQLQLWDYRANRMLFTRTSEMFHAFAQHPRINIQHIEQGRREGELIVSLVSTPPASPSLSYEEMSAFNANHAVSDFVWWNVETDAMSHAASSRDGYWSAQRNTREKYYLVSHDRHQQNAARMAPSLKGKASLCDEACLLAQQLPDADPLYKNGDNENDIIRARYQKSAQRAAILRQDRYVSIFDYRQQRWLPRSTQSTSRPSQPAMDASLGYFAMTAEDDNDDYLSIWSLHTGQESHRLPSNYSTQVVALGEQFLTWDSDTLSRYAPATGNMTQQYKLPDWNENDRVFPDVQSVTISSNNERLFLLEQDYVTDEEKPYHYRIRSLNADFSALLMHEWQLTSQYGLDGASVPQIDADSQHILRIEQNTLMEESLSGGKTTRQWSSKTLGFSDGVNTLIPFSAQRVALTSDDTLVVFNRKTEAHWRVQLPLGEWTHVSEDKQHNRLLAVSSFATFSRVLEFDLDSGEQLHAFVYPERLQSLTAASATSELRLGVSALGEMSVWRAGDTLPLFRASSLTDGNWVALNEQGQFDSSAPGDISALSWVLADAPRDALPLQAFMKEFYEPGLIPKTLRGETRSAAAIGELDRSMPTVTLTNVSHDKNGHASIKVNVTPGASGKAHDLRLFRDGQLVAWLPENGNGVFQTKTRASSYTFDNIALPPGESNVSFSAYAFNQDGIRSERNSASLVVETPPSENERRAFVITVGVNQYENTAFNLLYAANDANAYQRALGDALSHSNAIDEIVQISLISDADADAESSQGTEATRANLRNVLAALAGNGSHLQVPYPADINDQIIVTFSGHGYASPDGRFHFLMQDIGPGSQRNVTDALLERTFTSDHLADLLRPIESQQIALIIDACNSAASINQAGFKPGPMGSRGLGQLAYDKGMLVLAASQGDDVAIESRSLQHGLLTYALVREGMDNMRADFAPADHQLWLSEWLQYGQYRVPLLYQSLLSDLNSNHNNNLTNTPSSGETLLSGDRGFLPATQETAPAAKAQQPSVFNFSKSGTWLLNPAP